MKNRLHVCVLFEDLTPYVKNRIWNIYKLQKDFENLSAGNSVDQVIYKMACNELIIALQDQYCNETPRKLVKDIETSRLGKPPACFNEIDWDLFFKEKDKEPYHFKLSCEAVKKWILKK